MIDRLVIDHPKFRAIMSRDGKRLREDVFGKCLQFGTIGRPQSFVTSFCEQIIDKYNPIVWERAILYAHPSEVFDAVKKATSLSGNKKGSRAKDIDWLKFAIDFDHQIWKPKVQDPRKGAIDPAHLDSIFLQFMDMYKVITDWLIVDFGYKTLFGIFDMCKKYSVSIVKECIEIIGDDPQHKSIEYLLAIVDKELAIYQAQMLENKELIDRSKRLINTIVTSVRRDRPVEWDSIDKDIASDTVNSEEFDKVKLT